MSPRPRRRPESALTILEVVLVIAVVAILVGMFLPPLPHRHPEKEKRMSCANNLKNIGLAFSIFRSDNAGQFPWQIPGIEGTRDCLADPGVGWRHFAFISNELVSTRVLLCPADRERRSATNFATFRQDNLSYFLNLSAAGTNFQTIVAGDRNLTTNGIEVGPGLLRLGANLNVGFSQKLHHNAGDVLMADGSVQQVTSRGLRRTVAEAAATSTNAVNQLLIP